MAQSTSATVSGLVLDPSGKVIAGADIEMVNDVTGVRYPGATNGEGIYQIPDLPPGPYRLQVSKVGFKTLIKPDIMLNIQDALAINFTLQVGAASETVTIEGGASTINTTDGTVSTVIDRQFAENLPMNGRSFQTLIYLTPGVVATATNAYDNGQFSVNGQRAESNYWTVDGVSGNIGVGSSYGPGNGFGGALGSFSALGGTNSLVSVDALQEFRIQASTYAPEFGRTPGGQISIVTRSGDNQFDGSLFEYLRNDVFDAKDWFNGYTNHPPLPKAEERQNDFGGTFSGPLRRRNTFFFFSYEGLRLRLPQTTLSYVPDMASRQSAVPAMQPYLNAFPHPTPEAPDVQPGIARFNASYSNPASLDAYSLRLDHKLGSRWSLFGRYNYSPSEFVDRGGIGGYSALSAVQPFSITTQTATAGATWAASAALANDLRFNYSQVDSKSWLYMDGFGGAAPLTDLPFPNQYTSQNGLFQLYIYSLSTGEALQSGPQSHIFQPQENVVDTLSWQKGEHGLKFGVDYRRLTPSNAPPPYQQTAIFNTMSLAVAGTASGSVWASNPEQVLFRNLGVFAQDTWRVGPRLTVTYGLRWDVDFAPSTLNGPSIPAITGYDLSDLSNLAIAPAGTPPFRTTFGNLAPRLGAAYQITPSSDWQTVLRGGVGIFYDLVSSEAGNLIGSDPPFQQVRYNTALPYPWTPEQAAPPLIPPTAVLSNLNAFNPNLQLPYTLEWDAAVEQSLGKSQMASISYVGSLGQRLLQTTIFFYPPAQPGLFGKFIDNLSNSDYDALQVQFERHLSQGLQVLASYTWSHSIDDASAGSYGNGSNVSSGPNGSNRGDSDFDIRNSFSLGMTYALPSPRGKDWRDRILQGWSTDDLILARSAPPVTISDTAFFELNGGNLATIRPDLVLGQPLYLYGPRYPGGKAFNPGAFTNPPIDPVTSVPTRQGNSPRNSLRAFGATQWDFAAHREFPISEMWRLQFRAEMFNVVNHPNFGPPSNQFDGVGFGLSSQTLNESLSGNSLGAGGFSPLYQIGGPRSIQFAVKLMF
jgi:hypothetical protein